MVKITFETQVDALFSDAAAQRKLPPPAVQQISQELVQLWTDVGGPLRDRIAEIVASARFAKVRQLHERGKGPLLALGLEVRKVQRLLDLCESAVALADGARFQLVRVENAILHGLDPQFERSNLVFKESDSLRYELRAVSGADQEISARLTRAEEFFTSLLASQHRTAAV